MTATHNTEFEYTQVHKIVVFYLRGKRINIDHLNLNHGMYASFDNSYQHECKVTSIDFIVENKMTKISLPHPDLSRHFCCMASH